MTRRWLLAGSALSLWVVSGCLHRLIGPAPIPQEQSPQAHSTVNGRVHRGHPEGAGGLGPPANDRVLVPPPPTPEEVQATHREDTQETPTRKNRDPRENANSRTSPRSTFAQERDPVEPSPSRTAEPGEPGSHQEATDRQRKLPQVRSYSIAPAQDPQGTPAQLILGAGPVAADQQQDEVHLKLDGERKDQGTETDSPLVKALRCVLEKQTDEGLKILEAHQQKDPELVLSLLRLAAQSNKKKGSLSNGETLPVRDFSAQEVALLMEKLDHLQQKLSAHAPLLLDKVCFCQRIHTFGVYEPLPPGIAFQGGTDGRPGERVQVYVQVRNFTSKESGKSYETVLASSLRIVDAQQHVVARMDFPACTDRSRSRRQDYFINFQFHVPPRIPRGSYKLQIEVRDAASPATGQGTKPSSRSASTSQTRMARTSLLFRVK